MATPKKPPPGMGGGCWGGFNHHLGVCNKKPRAGCLTCWWHRDQESATKRLEAKLAYPVRKRKMMTFQEGCKAPTQHTKPCCDCPFSREAFPGLLAGFKPEEYCQSAHSEAVIDCHVQGPQSTGLTPASGVEAWKCSFYRRTQPKFSLLRLSF